MEKINTDFVICAFCGKKARVLTKHLRLKHNMRRRDYEKFTGELVVCKDTTRLERIAGKITHKLHPELSRMNGLKVRRMYPNLASESGKKCHILHPNLGHRNGLKTQYLHPNLSSNNLRSARLKNPNLSSKAGKTTARLHPELFRINGLKGIKSLRENAPYVWDGVHFDSRGEMECAKKILSSPKKGINCHIEINGYEIDFFPHADDMLYQNCFVEYHPICNLWDKNKTTEDYYKEREKIIDNSIYKGTYLVLITNLKQLEFAHSETPKIK